MSLATLRIRKENALKKLENSVVALDVLNSKFSHSNRKLEVISAALFVVKI